MSNYYRTNKLYEHLNKNPKSDLFFASGNMWQLVYGNKYGSPRFQAKVLLLVLGRTAEEVSKPLTLHQHKALTYLNQISKASSIPVCVISFSVDTTEIDSLNLLENDEFKEISLTDLTNKLRNEYGLDVNSATKDIKEINSKESSAYHKWQRNHLGNRIVVSDIDLIRTDAADKISTIYELKRSEDPLNDWKPYERDYNNYKLLKNLSIKCMYSLKVVYNFRQKRPLFDDDISRLKIFDVTAPNPSFSTPKTVELNDFLTNC